MIPKDLIEVVKDHENRTSVIVDTVIINLGTTEEPREIKMEKFLIHEDQE